MSLLGEQVLLRIYLHSADRAPHTPTYERVVKAARAAGMAGCTVLRGILGYGRRGAIGQSAWSITEHVPVIIEIVDADQKIRSLLPYLETVVQEGMITMEHVAIVFYRHNPADAPQA